MSHDLPIIDISSTQNRRALPTTVAKRIGRAARTTGFFYVTGHGIPTALLSRVFTDSARFFAMKEEEKAKASITRSRHNRGYVAMRGESLDPSKAPDLKEAFNIGLDVPANDPGVRAGTPFRGVNQWPDIPGWRETMLHYYEAAWSVGRRVHRAIALDLGVHADFFEDKLDHPMAVLRLLHYPPSPAAGPAESGAGEHTDYGNVTLLLTDSVGGLEVRRRDGRWVAAPPIPGALICNIGDCLMRWTNDVYVSTPHRVVNRAQRDRYSVAFFLDPNPDAVVDALPTCVTDARPAQYPPIVASDYLSERLSRTYAFLRKEPANAAA